MTHDLDTLTEKEKETLRLLLVGHDAKSMARELDLSVHTVNERLRHARRKLSVASSKEAARLLHEQEGHAPDPPPPHPHSLGAKPLGGASAAAHRSPGDRPERRPRPRRAAFWIAGGVAIMSIAALIFALSVPSGLSTAAEPAPAAAEAPAQAASATDAALQWLALVDAGKWPESYAGTTESFRTLNTLRVWSDASEEVRVPLGAVLSRDLLSEEEVPGPPAGYQLIRFQTSFEGKADTVERLSLAREDGAWKVVGYLIE